MTCKDCIYQCNWVSEPYETCERFKNKNFYGEVFATDDNKDCKIHSDVIR